MMKFDRNIKINLILILLLFIITMPIACLLFYGSIAYIGMPLTNLTLKFFSFMNWYPSKLLTGYLISYPIAMFSVYISFMISIASVSYLSDKFCTKED